MGILMEASDVNLARSGYRKTEIFAMGAPAEYYTNSVRSISLNTREAEYESIHEPLPMTLQPYKEYHMPHPMNYYSQLQPVISTYTAVPKPPVAFDLIRPSTSTYTPNTATSPTKVEVKDSKVTQPPPKKKWIKEYLEEPKSPLRVVPLTPRTNGVVVHASPPPAPLPAPAVALEIIPQLPSVLDFSQEHSRPRTGSNSHGPPQIPSPPSVGSSGSNGSNSGSGSSNGSTPRAGTREVHNKLEKNRRAHLKECFELLKRQLPATPDDKKTSNLSILGSAIRYIQVLRRKERECEHEMERLAREKIAAQQRLAALKRDVAVLACVAPSTTIESVIEDKPREDRVNGQVLGIPISITSSPPRLRLEPSPPRTLNLSTKLRTLPIQITPTTSQVVRSAYSVSRHNTLTLTTLASTDSHTHAQQNGHQAENGVSTLSTTLVHPAQIHLPLSQVVSSGGLVVGGALQLLSAPGALRVLHAPQINGVSSSDNNRISRDNGIVSPPPPTSTESPGSVVVSGLTPLVVSHAPHMIHSHSHKMVETQMMKGSMAPLTVSAQYLSATTIVKPVVMMNGAATPPSTSA